jgi:prepilin-type N-terminal cleavage/methylation domain-containing protein
MRKGVGGSKGFTLVEIMMVVIIIGILAVLAIPRYQKYTLEAKLSEVHVAAGEVKTGMEKYYNSHGMVYPTLTAEYANAELQKRLRIDLGQMRAFNFSTSPLTSGTMYGYLMIARLNTYGVTEQGGYAGRDTVQEGDLVQYYIPRELNPEWDKEAWTKGWNDDSFFE